MTETLLSGTVNSDKMVFSLKEVAAVIGCSKQHVSNVIAGRVSGLPPLPHVPIGRRIFVRRGALERWLEAIERQ